jgi:hypothetical protein
MTVGANHLANSTHFTVPIEDLETSRAFTVGAVEYLPSIDEATIGEPSAWESPMESRLARRDSQYRAVARARADSIETALDQVSQSLDVLRVFQFGLMRVSPYTHFGLPGEIAASPIAYLRSDENGHGFGMTTRGHFAGFTLTAQGIDSWEQAAEGLQLAGTAIANAEASESATRALAGVRYFAKAILADDADLRAFLVVAGLEALAKRDPDDRGRYQLARRYTYLSCWLKGGCGRIGGAACPYIALDPRSQIKDIQRLEELMHADVLWRCTFWEMVNTWYGIRSGLAHGTPEGIESAEASKFAYWAYHQYLAPMLGWLGDHPERPIEALDDACDAADAMGIDWPAAIRTQQVPDVPRPRLAASDQQVDSGAE